MSMMLQPVFKFTKKMTRCVVGFVIDVEMAFMSYYLKPSGHGIVSR